MNKINSLIWNRKSCRSYLSREVNEEDINILLESARWAPSGKNGQPWRFVILRDKIVKEKIANCSLYGQWMKEADTFIVVYLDRENSYNYKKDLQGVGAAIENICLQATALGLGSCWIGEILTKESQVNRILSVPQTFELMALICIGYENKNLERTKRMDLKDLIYKWV